MLGVVLTRRLVSARVADRTPTTRAGRETVRLAFCLEGVKTEAMSANGMVTGCVRVF